MHPILLSPRRLWLYLSCWLPILALLVWVTWASGGVSWLEATAALFPAALVYSFLCLSSWYVCRARPRPLEEVGSVAVAHGSSAIAGGLIFAGVAGLAAAVLTQGGVFAGLTQRLTPLLPLLLGMGVLLYLLSAGLHYAAIAAMASREAERRAMEARTLAREAELRALRMQINPHFLFNSLHSISALATQDGIRAREMCVRLADFLRGALALGSRETIPLGEELGLARAYLEIERARFGDRLRVEEDMEAGCEGCMVPALLLQPLVENAVKHGIAGLLEGGSVRISVRRTEDGVAILIDNAFDPDAAPPTRDGLGLAHVRRRLQVRYGSAAGLEAGPNEGVYRVLLRLPCESPMTSSNRA